MPRRPPGRPKGTGSGYVRKTLRRRILTGELPPDTNLDEPKLAKEFGVSRTPLREALIHLASEGYVELTPNRSPRVTPLPVGGLAPCYEALELSARILARWAAARRTEKHVEEMEMHNAACATAFDAEDYLQFPRPITDFTWPSATQPPTNTSRKFMTKPTSPAGATPMRSSFLTLSANRGNTLSIKRSCWSTRR